MGNQAPQLHHKYNLKLSEASTLPRFDHAKLKVVHLPPVVDMEPHMAPVFDQGSLGSCTGNAFVGALEFLENKRAGFVNTDAAFVGLSRLYVYFNERLLEGTINEDDGALIGDGIKAIANYGACKEEFFPYDVTKFAQHPSIQAYADGATRKAVQFSQPDLSQDAFLQTLAGGYPIVIGMECFSGLDLVGPNGMLPMPSPGEQSEGGHAVLVCGYDLARQVLKVRNSWGADWGARGYFFMPFAYAFAERHVTDAAVIEQIL
jgi:C1A family cysteine protease